MRILIVSYFFPPYNTIGAVRVGKMAKYLLRQGHDVRILTAKDQPLPTSLPVEVPEEKIVRTPWFNVNWLPEHFLGGRERVSKEGYSLQGKGRVLLRKMGKFYKTLFNFPDGQIGWFPYALKEGRRLLQAWQPDVIYASAMPFTSLLVARALGTQAGVPWVAELRDLWTENHYYEYGPLRRSLERFLERRLLSSAKGLVTVSEPLAQTLRERYKHPVAVILNGFDPEDIEDINDGHSHSAPDGTIHIVYTGSIYEGKYDLSTLFSALGALKKELIGRLQVHFYGRYLEPVRLLVNKLNIGNLVTVHSTVPYKEALKVQAQADALLLLLWNDQRGKGVYTGKLFEYIGARRPILAIGPRENVAAELIQQYNLGIVVSNVDEAKDALIRLVRGMPPFVPFTPDTRVINKFTREHQAKKLADFLQRTLMGQDLAVEFLNE